MCKLNDVCVLLFVVLVAVVTRRGVSERMKMNGQWAQFLLSPRHFSAGAFPPLPPPLLLMFLLLVLHYIYIFFANLCVPKVAAASSSVRNVPAGPSIAAPEALAVQ
ncbi:hypothetical protein niasHS_016599 [Heterodera schachtii]|uniref:Gland protein n=1 Tax=Heterodera schachtii TaxID=97005 RepID=A0ABD2I1R0_HETSC